MITRYMERYLRTTAPEAVADYAQLAVGAGLEPGPDP